VNVYLFGHHTYSTDNAVWQQILRKAYAAKLRPVCRCVAGPEAPALYISMIGGSYVLKRMPFSGALHASHCSHYEPPPELSGLGQVSGSAIREDVDTEGTTLALDFALTKGRSRTHAAGADVDHESVRADGTKLTMRALLHYLYDQAGLTRWTPAMEGRRSWYIVRREILASAVSKMTKGKALSDVLYLPESFNLERAPDIKTRQLEVLAPLAASPDARMILIGEVKAIEDARYGRSLVIKHMPDLRLMVDTDLARRMENRFSHQLQMWSQLDTSRMLILCTLSRSPLGVHAVEAACLMNVDQQWIPFDSGFEWKLLDALHRAGRRFVKGLRYNMPASKPMASVVLQDTGAVSTALYVVAGDAEAEVEALAESLSEETGMASWFWKTDAQGMPALPERVIAAETQPEHPLG
jgi:hypothetical protein